MKKNMIAKISEGLGNQLFMYANAFALTKKNNLNLYLDSYSGYYNKKSISNFALDNFNISSNYALKEQTFSNPYRHILKKLLLFLDTFSDKKKFLFELKNSHKLTSFIPLNLRNTRNLFFLDGNFESEKYFLEYRENLLKEFTFKNIDQFKDNKYLKLIYTKNVISISIRQNRYSERLNNMYSTKSIERSNFFLDKQVSYVKRAINFLRNKVHNPIFLIWSNDFSNLNNYFSTKDFIFVNNNYNKILTDFYLLTQCKYFIIAPSTFSWWGAWLSNFDDKICIRPKNLNNSNNSDFWPDKWLAI